jgi:hypothetical protein
VYEWLKFLLTFFLQFSLGTLSGTSAGPVLDCLMPFCFVLIV